MGVILLGNFCFYFIDEDDLFFHPDVDRLMYGGGSPLFNFSTVPLQPRQRWQNCLDRDRFRVTLNQERDATSGDNVGYEVMEAPRRVIQRQLDDDPNVRPDHRVKFHIAKPSVFTCFPVD